MTIGAGAGVGQRFVVVLEEEEEDVVLGSFDVFFVTTMACSSHAWHVTGQLDLTFSRSQWRKILDFLSRSHRHPLNLVPLLTVNLSGDKLSEQTHAWHVAGQTD